uniref:SNTX thioredoxin-like domain-containing protein n=1 Tax=Plectus sambesii TaxID=2011161 RepID=A0A914X4G0_9BILA
MATNMYHEKQALQVSNRSEDRLLSLVRILLLVGGVEPNPGPVEAGQLEIAALGRPFNLGMLYDARSEKTIPGVTLWDNETLKANVEKKEHKKVKVEIFENDTISGKTTALNLQANLKLSFLSGLVDIGGSGEYLKDYCDTTTTERITLQYNSTSHWESLGMDHLSTDKLQHLGVLEHKSATHIVTAIEYGADAFFLFDRKMSNKTDGTKFEGSLKSEIKGLKVMLGGSAAGKSKEKITDKSESIHCKYYGDFSLSNYPTNIKEARAAIQEIHKHLQSESVPKKVYLYPLSLLTDKAMKLVAQISASLLQRTEKQLQSLIDTRLIVSGILKVPELQHFGALKKEFMDYRAQVETSELLFQEKLRAILPNIRGGSMQESELTKVLETWSASMFRSDKMEEAVHGFKNELNYLAKKLHRIWQKVDEEVGEELKIEFSKPDEIDDNTVPILALEFNIADFRGSLIKECEESLIFLKSLNDPPEKREIKQVHSWYNDSEQKILAMQNMDIFLSFVASARKGQSIATKEGLQPARFVCVPDKSKGERGKAKSPISIVEYNRRNGTEINLPSYLSPPTVTNLTSNSAELEVELPSEGLEHILSVLILAKVNEHEYEIIKAQEHDNRNETKMVVKCPSVIVHP